HALEVGAGAGLGHGDRRDPLAGADPGQPRPLLLLGGVVDHVVRGNGGAHAHTERGVAGVHQLLGDQVLHRRVAALPAVLLGHVQADEAGLPGAHPGLAVDVLLFGPFLLVGRHLLGEERAGVIAEEPVVVGLPGGAVVGEECGHEGPFGGCRRRRGLQLTSVVIREARRDRRRSGDTRGMTTPDARSADAPLPDPFPTDRTRCLVLVAHPDDPEYGMSPAVARWTAEGRSVVYVLASSGEAGIEGMLPSVAGPIREEEQRRSSAVVGVDQVEFMGFPDSRIVNNAELRDSIADAIRRHRPDVVLSLYSGPEFAPGFPNQSDHMEF